jgi:hypothetical protein
MLGAKNKTAEVQNVLGQAKKLIDSMWLKEKKNKLILAIVFSVIVLFIIYRFV